MVRVLALIIGYICGLFQTGFIYGKLHGVDIRDYGSGNVGTTNVLRTFGKKAGYIVFLGDCLKVVAASIIISFTIGKMYPDIKFLLTIYAGLGVILGHNFPFYMGFKGGKGIAAMAGVVVSLVPYDWRILLVAVIVFFGMLFITKYVSLSSLVFSTVFLIEIIVLGQMGTFGMTQTYLIESYIVAAVITILAFVRHRENIQRLLNGTERKAFQKKKQEQ